MHQMGIFLEAKMEECNIAWASGNGKSNEQNKKRNFKKT